MMIGNILDNTTELYMIQYTFGEIFSSGGATLYKNPSDQTVRRRAYFFLIRLYLGFNHDDIVIKTWERFPILQESLLELFGNVSLGLFCQRVNIPQEFRNDSHEVQEERMKTLAELLIGLYFGFNHNDIVVKTWQRFPMFTRWKTLWELLSKHFRNVSLGLFCQKVNIPQEVRQ